MNGHCDFHTFEKAVDVCGLCYGDLCRRCVLPMKGRKDVVCKDCALTVSGVRGAAKPQIRGERRTVKERRKAYAEAGPAEDYFQFFDEDLDPADLTVVANDPTVAKSAETAAASAHNSETTEDDLSGDDVGSGIRRFLNRHKDQEGDDESTDSDFVNLGEVLAAGAPTDDNTPARENDAVTQLTDLRQGRTSVSDLRLSSTPNDDDTGAHTDSADADVDVQGTPVPQALIPKNSGASSHADDDTISGHDDESGSHPVLDELRAPSPGHLHPQDTKPESENPDPAHTFGREPADTDPLDAGFVAQETGMDTTASDSAVGAEFNPFVFEQAAAEPALPGPLNDQHPAPVNGRSGFGTAAGGTEPSEPWAAALPDPLAQTQAPESRRTAPPDPTTVPGGHVVGSPDHPAPGIGDTVDPSFSGGNFPAEISPSPGLGSADPSDEDSPFHSVAALQDADDAPGRSGFDFEISPRLQGLADDMAGRDPAAPPSADVFMKRKSPVVESEPAPDFSTDPFATQDRYVPDQSPELDGPGPLTDFGSMVEPEPLRDEIESPESAVGGFVHEEERQLPPDPTVPYEDEHGWVHDPPATTAAAADSLTDTASMVEPLPDPTPIGAAQMDADPIGTSPVEPGPPETEVSNDPSFDTAANQPAPIEPDTDDLPFEVAAFDRLVEDSTPAEVPEDPVGTGPALADSALTDSIPNPALTDPALTDPALTDPALTDSVLPDPAGLMPPVEQPEESVADAIGLPSFGAGTDQDDGGYNVESYRQMMEADPLAGPDPSYSPDFHPNRRSTDAATNIDARIHQEIWGNPQSPVDPEQPQSEAVGGLSSLPAEPSSPIDPDPVAAAPEQAFEPLASPEPPPPAPLPPLEPLTPIDAINRVEPAAPLTEPQSSLMPEPIPAPLAGPETNSANTGAFSEPAVSIDPINPSSGPTPMPHLADMVESFAEGPRDDDLDFLNALAVDGMVDQWADDPISQPSALQPSYDPSSHDHSSHDHSSHDTPSYGHSSFDSPSYDQSSFETTAPTPPPPPNSAPTDEEDPLSTVLPTGGSGSDAWTEVDNVQDIDGRTPKERADVDSRGSWIPPALRGMAPDAAEAGQNLPKRRRG